MHKGSGLISLKIWEDRIAGSQKAGSKEQIRALCEFIACAKILTVRENSCTAQKFAHYANFSACAKLSASHFRPRTTPFCIFSNFTLDVITFDMGILVFHYFVRLYIAILCTVEEGKPGNRRKDVLYFLDFPQSLLSSPFLSLSRQPNTPLRIKTQGMLG